MRFYSPAPIFDVEEILAQAMEDPKKYHALDNCPAPVKTIITSLTCSGFQKFHCDFAVNWQVKSMNSGESSQPFFHASVSDFLKSTKFRISRDEYFA